MDDDEVPLPPIRPIAIFDVTDAVTGERFIDITSTTPEEYDPAARNLVAWMQDAITRRPGNPPGIEARFKQPMITVMSERCDLDVVHRMILATAAGRQERDHGKKS